MFLFTTDSMNKIRQGVKTQTRRLHLRPRAIVGSIHYAQRTLHPDSRFAKLKILRVWEWDGETISDEDVKAEGFNTAAEFWQAFNQLNRLHKQDPERKHIAYEFRVVGFVKRRATVNEGTNV